jgi:membrane fusion protein (multidrug efflux system)
MARTSWLPLGHNGASGDSCYVSAEPSVVRMRPSSLLLRRAATLLGALLLTVPCLAACGPMGQADASDRGSDQDDDEEIATPVVVARVSQGEISAQIRATSTIEAERMVTVHAETTGRITALTFEEGDVVKEAQLLARIRQDLQRSGLDRASTSFSKAERDLDIVRDLFARGVASQQELTQAELAYDTATLDVRDRKRDVSNTRVQAPFRGTVTQRFVSEGAFVTSGAQILSIVDFDTLVARVYVPEKELDRLRVGQDAEIAGKAAQGRRGVGKLERIAPVVDATTGTVKVTISLPATLVGGDAGFLPGMYAEVTLTTEVRPKATLVPKQALVYDEEQPYLFVAEGDRARRVKVELGLTDREHAEVVSGVEVGQELVLTGHAGLKDGGLVTRVDPNGKPVESADATATPVEAVPAVDVAAAAPSPAAVPSQGASAVAAPEPTAKPKKKAKAKAKSPFDVFKRKPATKRKASAPSDGAADGGA